METALNVLRYANKEVDDIAAELRADVERGLSKEEAHTRLSEHGPNETKTKEIIWWDILLRQFKSPFTYLLAAAVVIALFVGNITDALVILLVIALNTGIGFYQEFKSDQAVRLLERYISAQAKVRRGGVRVRLPAREVVVGDIVLLQTGDVVPADARIVKAEGLTLNETTLTGESVPVGKSIGVLPQEAKGYYQAQNLVFSGTLVTGGSGIVLVVATGERASAGSLIHLAEHINRESEFAKGIGRFSSFIIRLVGITIVFIFAINLILKGWNGVDVSELLIFSIALAVSVIPEALPVVSVFSLSRGALRLAKRKVVVKRLSAIEDLGGIEILCTDKTGTLTENKLRVVDTFPKENIRAVSYGYLGSPFLGGVSDIDPFDLALKNGLKDDEKKFVEEFRHVSEIPFDPFKKRNVVAVESIREKNHFEIISRGAPESLLAMCANVPVGAEAWATEQGIAGKRVLAVIRKIKKTAPTDIGKEEKGFEFSGLIAFEDPIKDTAKDAVEKARKLGVQIKILTGDAPEVAAAVAKRVGLIKGTESVVLGEQLISLPLQEQRSLVETCSVFARVSPEQKYHIVSLLREKASVGFLGEGINDAPVLSAASVSLVVESASDATRAGADIILLDKSLAVVIEGLQVGRMVFANTLKYIRATLASNFGNFYAVAISSLFIDFLPLLPVQILLINLLSDFPMISIAADSVDDEEIARPQRYNVRDIALLATLLGIVSTIFDFLFFALYYKISPEVLQTNWFIASIITELAFLFSIRTRRPFIRSSRPASIILWLSGTAFFTTLILPFTAWGEKIFHFIKPQPFHILTILGVVVIYFIATEVVKILYYRYINTVQASK